MSRRLLSLLLVLAMVLSMMPMGVLAEEGEEAAAAAAATCFNGDDGSTYVSVSGQLDEMDAADLTQITVLAVSYDDDRRMTGSGYETAALSGSGFSAVLQLEGAPEGTYIQVYLLRPDLQPIGWGTVAEWCPGPSGTDGEIRWTLNWSSGLLCLSADPDKPTEMSHGPHGWDLYKDRVTGLTTEHVKSISDGAFADYVNLSFAELGEGLTAIGDSAFAGDSGIMNLCLPASLASIGENAFDSLDFWATVQLAEGFDRENVIIGPGNEVLEALMSFDWFGLDGAEETAPEAPEETVPETTEETLPEDTEEDLTAEEAAEAGYYIAPEGARLQEEAAAEELAAFDGTDKVSRGAHTASFTGLVPMSLYTLVVSKAPGSLEPDDLQYVTVLPSDGEGTLTWLYLPKTEAKAIVQVYGPEQLVLTASQDYVVLHPGETASLEVTANVGFARIGLEGGEGASGLSVTKAEDGNLWVLTAADSFDLAQTQYLEFVGNTGNSSARIRVRVDLVPKETQVTQAVLGETRLTYNLYDTAPLEIPLQLTLTNPELPQADEQTAPAAEKAAGRLIQDAVFTDGTDSAAKNYFDIAVRDDHTLLLTVKKGIDLTDAKAVKAIKSSYKMGFRLTFADEKEPLDTGVLTLSLQKKLPAIKAQSVTLNPFTHTCGYITFTGGRVTELLSYHSPEEALRLEQSAAEEGIALRMVRMPRKSGSKNLTAQVRVEGCSVPVMVTIPAKVDSLKVPALKLEQTTWAISNQNFQSVDIPLLCTAKGMSLEDMEIQNLTLLGSDGQPAVGYTVEKSLWARDTLTLTAYPGYDDMFLPVSRDPGEEVLTVRFDLAARDAVIAPEDEADAPTAWFSTPVELKLTVINEAPVLKFGKSQVTLNAVDAGNVEAIVPVSVTFLGQDLPVENVTYAIEGEAFPDATYFFNVQIYDGALGISLSRSYIAQYIAEHGLDWNEFYEELVSDTYTMFVDTAGDKSRINDWARLTIRLSADTPELVSLKATGKIDRSNVTSYVALTGTYKNCWGNRGPDMDKNGMLGMAKITVTNSRKQDCTEQFVWDYDYSSDCIRLYANSGNRPAAGKYSVLMEIGFGITSAKPASFTVTAAKPALKVTGKMDSALAEKYALITSNYSSKDADGTLIQPTVTLSTTGKNATAVDSDSYQVLFADDGIRLHAVTAGNSLLSTGNYTVTVDYRDGSTPLTASVTVTQTAPVLKLEKSSVTIHPYITEGKAPVHIKSLTGGTWDSSISIIEYYQSNGKTKWGSDCPVTAQMHFEDGYLTVSPAPNGAAPARDTTVKIKLTPDKRIPSRFTWLTVKVLGGKNLTQKVTLKALNTIDPSCISSGTNIQLTLKGFDNRYEPEGSIFWEIQGTAVLKVSRDKGKNYQPVELHPGDIVYPTCISVDGMDPAYKYRLEVTYARNGKTAAFGTADLKVAYGSNKFTVAKAPTLYKVDPYAAMDIHLNARSQAQQIGSVTVKGNPDFVISRSMTVPNDQALGSQYDWVLRYTGDHPEKLKTTTLTLQIFLKGNTTAKPNFTTNVKVTVK